MRGFIFIDFLIAAVLLLTTVVVVVTVCCHATATILKNFLYFDAMSAHSSLLVWQIAGKSVVPEIWSHSVSHLPKFTVTYGVDPKLCWQYLGAQECYK